MPDATATETAAPKAAESAPKPFSFLTELENFGGQIIAAELPGDVRKVLGGLIHWIDAGGEFKLPAVFDSGASQLVEQAQADSDRVAQQNRELSERLLALEARLTVDEAPAPTAVVPAPSEPAAPAAAGASAPAAPAIPGLVEAPAEAAAAPAPVTPVPPASV